MLRKMGLALALVCTVGAGVLLMSSCGTAGDQPSPAALAPSPPQLERFLMRKGEQPGFRRVDRAETFTGVAAFVKDNGMTSADARRLRSAGFISFMYQPTRGPRTDGLTNVALFATAEGARADLANEQKRSNIIKQLPGAKIRRLARPRHPGRARLDCFDGRGPHRQRYWVQGRCMHVLGNQGPGPFAGPLSTGAKARSTSGRSDSARSSLLRAVRARHQPALPGRCARAAQRRSRSDTPCRPGTPHTHTSVKDPEAARLRHLRRRGYAGARAAHRRDGHRSAGGKSLHHACRHRRQEVFGVTSSS